MHASQRNFFQPLNRTYEPRDPKETVKSITRSRLDHDYGSEEKGLRWKEKEKRRDQADKCGEGRGQTGGGSRKG